MVDIAAELNEQLYCMNMTLTHCIIDRRLPILVLPVDVVLGDIDQVLDHFIVALAAGIEDGCLLKRVFFGCIDAEFCKRGDHSECKCLIRHDASREDQ